MGKIKKTNQWNLMKGGNPVKSRVSGQVKDKNEIRYRRASECWEKHII